MERYRPDLLWFDGEWERAEEQWGIGELADRILAVRPDTVLNARMLGRGDYATPEQGVPLRAPDGPWELCPTVNDSWGYRHHDHRHKSVGRLVRYFTETIGAGGNLLLDVGPRAARGPRPRPPRRRRARPYRRPYGPPGIGSLRERSATARSESAPTPASVRPRSGTMCL